MGSHAGRVDAAEDTLGAFDIAHNESYGFFLAVVVEVLTVATVLGLEVTLSEFLDHDQR
jgi:hypothetical protein